MTRQAEDFARRLERRFKLPVARVDERYTSVEAEQRLRGVKNGGRWIRSRRSSSWNSTLTKLLNS